jgi:hypothetical protein
MFSCITRKQIYKGKTTLPFIYRNIWFKKIIDLVNLVILRRRMEGI